MMGVRAQQKEKTRRSLVEAAFSQLSAERSFASLSLREVAREAGIAPTSFYRHFRDVDELGLTMVDESGLMLRQLMRRARQRIAKGGSVIRTSVSTFMEFIGNNPNAFRPAARALGNFCGVSRRRRTRDPALYCGTRRLFRTRKPYAARLYRSAG
ncbi:hypothetical protein KPZU09_50460 [Klebsiella pneumoniae]|uniref:HTH tetR-type domain-containing protein n=1 Tax=Klebsiella pneumoniae TaxID=573 RepID=A0A919HW76_KLEPN|nr:hypothetical protein KPZU09_50460 [Klebsiella pneumoniae]